MAALRWAKDNIGGIAPGEDVEYVVNDDVKASRDRVELLSEDPEDYDTKFYVGLVERAATGILGPFGYTQEDVDELTNEEEADLHATAIQDTGSTYTSIEVSVSPSGHGYQIPVSNAPYANLREGDTPSETTAPGVVVLAGESRSGGSMDRLAADLATIRRDQLGH